MAQAPHMLVGGTTGSGKSTVLHTMIANLIPHNCILHLMDTKNVEFAPYDCGFKNIKVFREYNQCLEQLKALTQEMEWRYNNLSVKDLPYHVLIIDEFADIIIQDETKEFQTTLCKLAQKSRAAKIHIILATQRPSANIINGSIKANFPTRLSCKVASALESKIVLDGKGAEKLNGHGDALIKSNDCMRFQVAYTTPQEICEYYQIST
jgi:S-DNA-T family DNA segregation ATPase FtsK/SpoIIIE